MTERERRLLRLLLVTLALGLILVALSMAWEFRKSSFLALAAERQEVESMRRIASTLPDSRERLSGLESRPGGGGTKSAYPDLYTLGTSLSRRVLASGLRIQRSGMTGAGKEAVLELELQGRLEDILVLMEGMDREPGYILVSTRITIDEKTGKASSLLRLGQNGR